MVDPIPGSCACGAVSFELIGPPLFMATCHCTRCRKVGGSTTVAVRAEHFRWICGESSTTRYNPEPPYHLTRVFCSSCGSYIGEPDASAEGFPISANALDADPGVRRALHEHVAEKAAWYEIDDSRPQFRGGTPKISPSG